VQGRSPCRRSIFVCICVCLNAFTHTNSLYRPKSIFTGMLCLFYPLFFVSMKTINYSRQEMGYVRGGFFSRNLIKPPYTSQ